MKGDLKRDAEKKQKLVEHVFEKDPILIPR